ncbi:MAG: hypothetical protein ACMXYF_05455, partial [Candidatus Woesearchaeota archaeon]
SIPRCPTCTSAILTQVCNVEGAVDYGKICKFNSYCEVIEPIYYYGQHYMGLVANPGNEKDICLRVDSGLDCYEGGVVLDGFECGFSSTHYYWGDP